MTEMMLDAYRRSGTRKGVTRKLRAKGIVPAVLYGLNEPESIQVDAKAAGNIVKVLHGSERLITLTLADAPGSAAKSHKVLLKEVQATPVGAKLLHLDFLEVDVLQKVTVSVEIRPVGKAKGETFGGLVQQVTREVMVACLPTSIPEFLEIDVSALEIGHSLHVKDLVLNEGIETLTNPEETLIVVAAPRVEAEAVEGEEGEEALAGEAAPEGAPKEGEES